MGKLRVYSINFEKLNAGLDNSGIANQLIAGGQMIRTFNIFIIAQISFAGVAPPRSAIRGHFSAHHLH